jgi:hypothetical protein
MIPIAPQRMAATNNAITHGNFILTSPSFLAIEYNRIESGIIHKARVSFTVVAILSAVFDQCEVNVLFQQLLRHVKGIAVE